MLKKSKNSRFGIFYFTPRLLKFENPSVISEEDMMHLFMGFVRLIKKSIETNMENKYLTKIKQLEKQLKSK